MKSQISTINENLPLILLVLTLKNWIKIYIAIVLEENLLRRVTASKAFFYFFFFLVFTHKAMMLSERRIADGWKERKTLYVSITWRAHQRRGFFCVVEAKVEKKEGKFSLILKQQ
jgi:hypothetical protein